MKQEGYENWLQNKGKKSGWTKKQPNVTTTIRMQQLAKCAITLRDLSIERYWFIKEIEEVEDSLEDGEASTDTTNNKDKHKCSETNK